MALPWTGAERRWRNALCAAVVPPPDDGLLPGLGALPTDDFWREVEHAAPLLLRIGLRGAVLAISLCPPIVVGRLATFDHLPRHEQERVVERLAGSRFFLVRQLPTTLKLMACFAYLRDGDVRDRVDRQGRP